MSSTPKARSAAVGGNRTPIQIRTPAQRALAGDPDSHPRHLARTPLDRSVTRDLLNSVRRGTQASGGARRAGHNAPTPHAAAARRALISRRTAIFTPGKGRRRSLREQRDTPLGLLRNLGRVLAPSSQQIRSSSSSPGDDEDGGSRIASMTPPLEVDGEEEEEDDDDDELTIDRPRLSLPLDEEDDDYEDELRPPRLSILDDTVQSVELPRRMEPPSRLSRGSLGSVGAGDMFENDATLQGGAIDRSEFFPGLLEDLQARAAQDETLHRVDNDETMQRALGRESDFGLQIPEGLSDDHSTFLFDDQGLAMREEPPPPLENSFEEAMADHARAQELQGPEPPPMEFDHSSSPAGVPFSQGEAIDKQSPLPFHAQVKANREQGGKGSRSLRGVPKRQRVSRHGIPYPALPTSFVKRVAATALQSSGLSNHKISPETLEALAQASDWFLEQLGDDLSAYANHAKRRTIEESDVATLMRRQRQVGSHSTLFSIAQRHLPRELLQELRMPAQPARRGKR